MAAKKSAQYPYQWANGEWHSKPQATGPQKGVERPGVGPQKGLPQAGPSPAAPAGGGAFIPDAQYLAEAAQRAFDRQTQIDQYNQQSTQDKSARDEAIRRLLDKVGDDRSQISTGANKQGLFYSGQLTKQLGDYEKAVTRQQADYNTDWQNREDARQAAIKALQSGAPLEEASALAAAANRQVVSNTGAADAGALVANSAPSGAQGQAVGTLINNTGNARSGQSFTTESAPGGEWHVYANRRVWVPRRR